VIPGFSAVVAFGSLLVAAWSFVLAARGREPRRALLAGLAVVEVLLVVQLGIGVALLVSGHHPGSLATYLAYLAGSLVVLPVGTVWALAERSRSSTVVLGIACLAIPVMVLRLYQVWNGTHA
jgi:hypothetical protein